MARIEAGVLHEITIGSLAPGARLDEAKLTEQFGVSRTPVREALSRLLAQGVLVPCEKRGVQVAMYSREQLAQVFEAMREIEVACARAAAQRLTLLSRAEILEKQEACLDASKKGNRHDYLLANEEFHAAIYRATCNPYLAAIARDFRHRTGPFRSKKFATKQDLVASAKSHQMLIDQLFSEDSRVASEGMRNHMDDSFISALKAN